MRVLVTGHKGTVGSALMPALSAAGHGVVGFDILDNQDIRKYDDVVRAMLGCDAVIHLAAIPHPFRRENYDEINRQGGENVIAAAVERGIKTFIYMSSSDVYGLCGGPGVPEGVYEPLPAGPLAEYDEDFNHLNDCPYANSKYDVEIALAKSGIPIPNRVVFRLEAPFLGPDDTRIGATCSVETLQAAVLKALEYEGTLVANLVDPHELFDTSRLEALLAS